MTSKWWCWTWPRQPLHGTHHLTTPCFLVTRHCISNSSVGVTQHGPPWGVVLEVFVVCRHVWELDKVALWGSRGNWGGVGRRAVSSTGQQGRECGRDAMPRFCVARSSGALGHILVHLQEALIWTLASHWLLKQPWWRFPILVYSHLLHMVTVGGGSRLPAYWSLSLRGHTLGIILLGWNIWPD